MKKILEPDDEYRTICYVSVKTSILNSEIRLILIF